ncbi:hypothetical protein HRbin06_00993 [archaeon HR06]|nr:hypothetical protein HRbin06_00993 [archaeon HR06]
MPSKESLLEDKYNCFILKLAFIPLPNRSVVNSSVNLNNSKVTILKVTNILE